MLRCVRALSHWAKRHEFMLARPSWPGQTTPAGRVKEEDAAGGVVGPRDPMIVRNTVHSCLRLTELGCVGDC